MSDPSARSRELFFELFESLPRQGPGSRESTARALAACPELPAAPAILDLGCGTGAQALDLAELTAGSIVAVDLHAPSIARLVRTVAARGLADRIRPTVGDMAQPAFAPGSFDLIWSEGALYNVGIEQALAICRPPLRPGGCLAFTDAVWTRADPAAEARAAFEDYPGMGRVADIVARIGSSSFELLGHFTLPEAAWWDDFYTPMERRIGILRRKYESDHEALAALDCLAGEIQLRRRHGASYAYEFFIARRPRTG